MSNLKRYYEFHQEGTKENAPVIVFVPGVCAGAPMFEDALKYFLPDFKVLLLNNPGVNGAPMWWVMSVEKIATHIEAILDKLEIESCYLVGHSMGGFITQRLAQNATRFYPKVVLMSTSYGGPFTEGDLVRVTNHVKGGVEHIEKPRKDDLQEQALKMVFSEKFQRETPEKFEAFKEHYHAHYPGQSIHMRHFWCGAHFNGYREAHTIKNETLVIHGEEDHLVHFDGGLLLAKQIPSATLWRIPECGHFPFVERDDIYPRIKDYLLGESVGEMVEKDEAPEQNILGTNQTFKMLQNMWEGWKK